MTTVQHAMHSENKVLVKCKAFAKARSLNVCVAGACWPTGSEGSSQRPTGSTLRKGSPRDNWLTQPCKPQSHPNEVLQDLQRRRLDLCPDKLICLPKTGHRPARVNFADGILELLEVEQARAWNSIRDLFLRPLQDNNLAGSPRLLSLSKGFIVISNGW